MKKREIFVVALKILGIYLLVRAIEFTGSIGYLVGALTRGDEVSWYFLGGVIPFLLYIAAGFCLIKWAEPIAAKLSGKEEAPAVEGPLDKSALQEIAFSTVGILIVVGALPKLVRTVPLLSQQWTHQRTLEIWASIIALALQLGIGLFLFLGSKGLAGLLKKIKSI